MPRLRAHTGILCFILIFELVFSKKCDVNDLLNVQCPPSQLCDESSGICVCKPGFTTHNETYCVGPPQTTPNSSSLVASHHSGSIVAGILIPLFLVLFVIYAVYVSRKYRLVTWVRSKMRRRHNYDEFMIGQEEDDDPPLH